MFSSGHLPSSVSPLKSIATMAHYIQRNRYNGEILTISTSRIIHTVTSISKITTTGSYCAELGLRGLLLQLGYLE